MTKDFDTCSFVGIKNKQILFILFFYTKFALLMKMNNSFDDRFCLVLFILCQKEKKIKMNINIQKI